MDKALKFAVFIGLILFVLVLVKLDLGRIGHILKDVNPAWLLAGSIFIPAEALFKSLKLKAVIDVEERITFRSALASYLIGLPFGAVTPGKVGDLVKVYAVRKRTKLKLMPAFALLMVERLLELLTLLLLALIGLYLLVAKARGKIDLIIPIAASVSLCLFLLLLLREDYVRKIARSVANILIPQRFHERLRDNFDSFYGSIAAVLKDKARLTMAVSWSLIAWFTISSRAFCYARSLGIGVSFGYLAFLIPAVIVIELLPISIMGLGTREVTLIGILSMFGVEPEKALSLSIMTFILGPIPLMVIGYFWAVKDNLSLKKVETEID